MVIGILRLIVFGIDTAFWIPAVMLASLADRDARLAYRMAQHWAAFNLKLTGTRVAVDGLEQLDPRQSYVFMSNHRSNLDVLALVEALWKFQLRVGGEGKSSSGSRGSDGACVRRARSW